MALLDADEFHSSANLDKMAGRLPLSDEDRQPWLEQLRQAVRSWIEQNLPTVLACSAVKASFRRNLVEGLEDQGQLVYLKGNLGLIAQRLDGRKDHYMHVYLLARQLEIVEGRREALIVDIDDSPDRLVAHIRSNLGL